MGILSNHSTGVSVSTANKATVNPVSGLANTHDRPTLNQELIGGTFKATDENGVMGSSSAGPNRINDRVNGAKT